MSSKAPNWIGVRVAMQSVLGTAKTVTAITKASPGVASSTAHGFLNGDYYLLNASGMDQVNNRVFRAAAVATDTLQLDGEDTTGYETFIAGTAKKITFGTAFSTLAEITPSGGDFAMIDTTTIHDIIKTEEPGLPSALSFTFQSDWDLTDPALVAAMAASKAKSQMAFLFTFQTGVKMAFYGFVGASGVPKGAAGGKVRTPITISASNVPTYFAS